VQHIPIYVWITGCVCVVVLTFTFCINFWTASQKEVEFANVKVTLGSATDGLEQVVNNLITATIKLESAATLLAAESEEKSDLIQEITKDIVPVEEYDKLISNLKDTKSLIYHVEGTGYPGGKLWLGGAFRVVPSKTVEEKPTE